MAGERKSLRDMIESKAAQHGVASRELWKLALNAILDDVLMPILPADCSSLDKEFNHGGQRINLRKVIRRVLPTIDSYGPPNSDWTRCLEFDDAPFEKWLRGALKDQQLPAHPKRRAGAKPTPREMAKLYEKYQSEIPSGVTFKQIANELGISERTVRRAYGRK
ncbi:MAG: hypothetical protein WAV38_14850 [Xanthobacteraceae bacterium]